MNSVGEKIIETSSKNLLVKDPLVSVVIITYNHENFISETIESIACQEADFQFEIIISEDCSSDNTRQIAIEYQKKHPELIRVLYGENNLGPGRNFQRALSCSRGKYIAICEGDDQWNDVTKIQKQVAYLSKHNDIVVTYHDAISIDDKGDKIADSQLASKGNNYDFTAMQLQLGMYLPTLTMCFRNVISELPDEFFLVVNQDSFLISLLGAFGGAKYLGDIQPAKYRVHEGGVWSTLSSQDKSVRYITTAYWLSVYYKRTSNLDLSSKYSCFAILRLLSQLHVKKKDFLNLALKWLFSGLYNIYRNIRYKKKI